MKKLLWFIGVFGNTVLLITFLINLTKNQPIGKIIAGISLAFVIIINIWYYFMNLKQFLESKGNIITLYFERKRAEAEIKMLEARKHLESLKNTTSSEDVKQ